MIRGIIFLGEITNHLYECPEGVAKFFDTSELLLQRYEVGDNPLKSLWGDMKILSM